MPPRRGKKDDKPDSTEEEPLPLGAEDAESLQLQTLALPEGSGSSKEEIEFAQRFGELVILRTAIRKTFNAKVELVSELLGSDEDDKALAGYNVFAIDPISRCTFFPNL